MQKLAAGRVQGQGTVGVDAEHAGRLVGADSLERETVGGLSPALEDPARKKRERTKHVRGEEQGGRMATLEGRHDLGQQLTHSPIPCFLSAIYSPF